MKKNIDKKIIFALAFFTGIIWTGLANYAGAEINKLLILGFIGLGFIILTQIIINWNNKKKIKKLEE